jgi:hypothetical protein
MPDVHPEKSPKSSGVRSANNAHHVGHRAPSWLPYLSQYTDQRILTFRSPKDLDAAIDMLWSGELRTLPHDTPDGKSLVVPAEAVSCFTRAGLRFTERKVRSISELTTKEIGRLRG